MLNLFRKALNIIVITATIKLRTLVIFKSQHIKSVHERIKYDCTLCDYKASSTSSLLQHVKNVHEGSKYDCTLCDYKATSKYDLKKHLAFNQKIVFSQNIQGTEMLHDQKWVFPCEYNSQLYLDDLLQAFQSDASLHEQTFCIVSNPQ